MTKYIRISIYIYISLTTICGCQKISVAPPIGPINSHQVFSTDEQATAAASAIFYNMINTSQSLTSSGMTILAGMSADELTPFDQSTAAGYIQFADNTLTSNNNNVNILFWVDPYAIIYISNSVISGLENSNSIHDSVKLELLGEAKFARAFLNFYLANLFGDIPMVNSINWHNTSLLGRTNIGSIYDSIIADLKSAENLLAADFSTGNGERIIPNKWSAKAMLARVYLYRGDWDNSDKKASEVINHSSLFSLESDLNNVFLKNSSEAIWQLQQNDGISYNATPEGYRLIPRDSSAPPLAFIRQDLLNSFEPKDARRKEWIDSTLYNGVTYYYPYKYKIGAFQSNPNASPKEYYTVLRLSEQLLIRAEARAMQNNFDGAVMDLNAIRKRAGLDDVTQEIGSSLTLLLSAIMHERRIELFAEWGHRWLDLKRKGMADSVLNEKKPSWTSNDQLYPIPVSELRKDPNLIQNPGY